MTPGGRRVEVHPTSFACASSAPRAREPSLERDPLLAARSSSRSMAGPAKRIIAGCVSLQRAPG